MINLLEKRGVVLLKKWIKNWRCMLPRLKDSGSRMSCTLIDLLPWIWWKKKLQIPSQIKTQSYLFRFYKIENGQQTHGVITSVLESNKVVRNTKSLISSIRSQSHFWILSCMPAFQLHIIFFLKKKYSLRFIITFHYKKNLFQIICPV